MSQALIYLHGFNSSPQSEKASLTRSYIEQNSGLSVHVPALPAAPLAAIDVVHQLVKQLGRDNLLGFAGSSLGGFYSLYLQQYYAEQNRQPKLVLINPAIRPYELLLDYLGENRNMYTGERYIVDHSHMADLKALAVAPPAYSSHIYLLTQTHDEVLDFQQAVSFLPAAKMWIHAGGSHAFEGYREVLPSMLSFLLDD
jgi:predicted esterase YcpF (UPF0227 family)